jgi:hypothetical protein
VVSSSMVERLIKNGVSKHRKLPNDKALYLRQAKACNSINCRHFSVREISLNFDTGVLHLIQINHQLDAIIFQFIILTFVYSSTCFGRFPTHHQEHNDCSGSLWIYLRIVVIVVLCSWPAGSTTNTARLSSRCEGKTRGCHCSQCAPDDGRENTRNVLSCKQTSG